DDLQLVFDETVQKDDWPVALRSATLQALAQATRTRGVVPSGNLNRLNEFVKAADPELRTPAIQLAGVWKVSESTPLLVGISNDDTADRLLRELAVLSWRQHDPSRAKRGLDSLEGSTQT